MEQHDRNDPSKSGVSPNEQGGKRRVGDSFGNWPELVGLIATIIICWLVFALRG